MAESKAPNPNTRKVVISVDSHVRESDEMWKRIPKHLHSELPSFEKQADGGEIFEVGGSRAHFNTRGRPLSDDDQRLEFRNDPSGGTDLTHRLSDMHSEGVHAQVVFPDVGLMLGGGRCRPELNVAWSRVYNDWVWEVFEPERKRFYPAAILQVDDLDETVREAERCVAKGFKTLFLPPSVPWRPYHRPEYERLWSFAEECGIPLNFHVFAGNLWFGSDLAFMAHMSQGNFDMAQKLAEETEDGVRESLATTVIGMSAGMGPIVHLTGAGVLERHPGMRFIITEAECGWLAWTLDAMDAMQKRRGIFLDRLELKPSEYFLRQGSVAISDDRVGLNNLSLTGSKCLVWGNDYPHQEGLFPHSQEAIDEIRNQATEDEAYDILCGNAAALFGFDLEYLAQKSYTEAAA